MPNYYKVAPLKDMSSRNRLESLFEKARHCFVHRRFAEALQLMEEARELCPRKWLPAVRLNMALFHHVLGHQEAAEELYNLTEDTVAKLINYAAFCHRYFLYSKFHGGDVVADDSLQPIYRHNKLNFRLATEGIAAVPRWRSENIFDERLRNDFCSKAGLPQENFFRKRLASEVTVAAEKLPKNFLPAVKNRVGIYVNDIQRHKETAFIYDLIDILHGLGCAVYVYFDNLFENKLVRLLQKEIVLRNVINLGILGFNNLVAADRVSVLLDLTGNKLRTRLTSFSLRERHSLSVDDLFADTPLCLQSEIYFGEPVTRRENIGGLVVIGDLKYISDEEISCINAAALHQDLVFMSFAFCEEICRKNFERRLSALGMNLSRCKVMPGVLPFKRYLEVLAASSTVAVTSGANAAELSEVIFAGAPVMLLSKNQLLRKIGNAVGLKDDGAAIISSTARVQDGLREMRDAFIKNLRERLENAAAQSVYKYLFDEELRLQYQNGDFSAEVNMSCNGDLLIFSELGGVEC